MESRERLHAKLAKTNAEASATLWARVREARARRQERRDLWIDIRQGAICVIGAILAYNAMGRGGEFGPVYELVGRVAVGAGVYCAIVLGVKYGMPRVWYGEASPPRAR